MSLPGRSCPHDYRYAAHCFVRPAELHAETIYLIGGLYGNRFALAAALALREKEASGATLVFNGDFNWFNVNAGGFANINQSVLEHVATRGNVEAELGREGGQTDCGCSYPEWVDAATVKRSNQIFARLKQSALQFPDVQKKLAALPMHLVAEVGGTRIAIVHGDAESIAGWRFSQESLSVDDPEIAAWFGAADVRVFACTHTCLPVLKEIPLAEGVGIIVNNGAAGMPNFRGARFGLLTRISTFPAPQPPLYGVRLNRIHIDALALDYDHSGFLAEFLHNWPPGAPAHASYLERIVRGPNYDVTQALRLRARK